MARSIPHLYQIYSLHDPETGEIRYVGETTMTLDCRLREHIYSARNPPKRENNCHRRTWICSLLKRGLMPEIRLIEQVTSADEMDMRERYWIAFYRSNGARLTNTADGGGRGGPTAGSDGAKKIGDKTGRVYLGFIDPHGEIITISNMKRFCDEHGLTRKSMMDVYHGHKLSHKGFRHISTVDTPNRNVRWWTGFVRPDGTREPPFLHLRNFCKQNNLHISRLCDLIAGKCEQYKGWRYIANEGWVYSLDD